MRVISFFSGAGGMDLGFELAGHRIVWANDFDKDAVETYNYNIGRYSNHSVLLGDICNILNDYSESTEGIYGNIPDADILIGGFPCQGFSVANLKRNMDDERNYLYLEILRVIQAKNPKFVILENVKGLENIEKGEVLNMIIQDIQNTGIGYTVVYNVFNAYNFGVPQNRERVIILGVRNDILENYTIPVIKSNKNLKNKYKKLYIPITHSIESSIQDPFTSYEKINFLYENWRINNLDFNQHYYFNNEIYSVQTVRNTISDLPFEFCPDSNEYYNHTGTLCKVKIKNTVGNRETLWDKYSPTIMGRGSGTGGPLIIPHPEQHRRLSIREVARIQTFPDKFIFKGSNSACYRQIGNAVPVLMAYNIAKLIPLNL